MSIGVIAASEVLGAGGFTTYDAAVLADAPSAYYRMNEVSGTTLVDASGNSRNGTYSGSITLNQAGLVPSTTDACADFTNGKAGPAYGSWLAPTAFSVEAWFKLNATGTRTIVARHGPTSSNWTLRIESTTLFFYYWNSAGTLASISKAGLAIDTIYHVAVTYDGSYHLFLNGTEVATSSAVSVRTGNEPLWIGDFGSGGENFYGKIDEVAFYGTALAASRVQAHYRAGYGKYAIEVLADAPSVYWPLSEQSLVLSDISGNGKTLTPVGSPSVGSAGPFAATKSVSLNGSTQRLDSNQLMSGATDRTVEFWYKGTDTQGLVLSNRSSVSSDRGLSVFVGYAPLGGVSAGQLAFGLSGDSYWQGVRSTVAINDGNWHHVVCIWDGVSGQNWAAAQATLVIDGVVDTPVALSGVGTVLAPYTSSVGWSFGGSTTETGAGYLSGNISELAIYPVPLTVARAQAHYAARL